MPIRGDVYLASLVFPGDTEPRTKFIVALQSTPGAVPKYIATVVASSDRRQPGQTLRPYEVGVGAPEGFDHGTVIDCRWVFTLLHADVAAVTPTLHLSSEIMARVDLALFAGLQMR